MICKDVTDRCVNTTHMETIPFALGPMEDGNSSVRSQAPGHGSESAESEFKFEAARARQVAPAATGSGTQLLPNRGIQCKAAAGRI